MAELLYGCVGVDTAKLKRSKDSLVASCLELMDVQTKKIRKK